MRSNPWTGRGLCVGAAALWSTSGFCIKGLAYEAGWSGWQVAGMRSLIAGGTILVLARLWPDPAQPRRGPSLPTRRQWALAIAYAGTLLTYVLAQTYTTTANAIFLQYTAPIYILVLSAWLLREKPRKDDLLTLPALVAGIYLILSAELQFDRGGFGNAMALISGAGYALVIMLLRKWRNDGVLGGMALGNLLLAAVGVAAALGSPQGFVGPTLRSGALILWLGVFQIGVAYFLFQASLRSITAVEASLMTLLEPVLCTVWAWLVVADRPPARSLLGCAVILAALVAHTLWKARAEARPAPIPAPQE